MMALALSLLFAALARADFDIETKAMPCPGNTGHKVHLSFDDGPSIPETEIILDELKKRGLKATFLISTHRLESLLGPTPTVEAQRLMGIVRRMRKEGHTVGSHSCDHIEHANLSAAQRETVDRNLERNAAVMRRLRLNEPVPFRFPYGSGWFQDKNEANQQRARVMMQTVKKAGYLPFHWDLDTWDWSKIKRKALPESLLRQVCTHKGGVILMHDVQEFTAKNLPVILDSLAASGHKAVSFEEIRAHSASLPEGLSSFAESVAGIFSCSRPVSDLDQVWPSCEAYRDHSSDTNKHSDTGDAR